MFIALQDTRVGEPPWRYVELEISPHNVLFEATSAYSSVAPSHRRRAVTNESGDCRNFTGVPHPCNASALAWHTNRTAGAATEARGRPVAHTPHPDGWQVQLDVPFQTLARLLASSNSQPHALWVNFFRIELERSVGRRRFSAWRATYANPACFHVPRAFGRLLLNDTSQPFL